MENNRLNHYATIDAYKTYVNMFVFMMLFYVAFYIIIFVLGSINSEIVNSEYIIYLEILVSPLLFCSLFFWQNRGKRYNTWNIIGIDNRIKVKPCLLAIVLAIGCLIFFANFS